MRRSENRLMREMSLTPLVSFLKRESFGADGAGSGLTYLAKIFPTETPWQLLQLPIERLNRSGMWTTPFSL